MFHESKGDYQYNERVFLKAWCQSKSRQILGMSKIQMSIPKVIERILADRCLCLLKEEKSKVTLIQS